MYLSSLILFRYKCAHSLSLFCSCIEPKTAIGKLLNYCSNVKIQLLSIDKLEDKNMQVLE